MVNKGCVRYMRTDGIRRVVVPLYIDEAFVLDQNDELACSVLGIDPELSKKPWIPALQVNGEPPSWKNSDLARSYGADGLIDCSRLIPAAGILICFDGMNLVLQLYTFAENPWNSDYLWKGKKMGPLTKESPYEPPHYIIMNVNSLRYG